MSIAVRITSLCTEPEFFSQQHTHLSQTVSAIPSLSVDSHQVSEVFSPIHHLQEASGPGYQMVQVRAQYDGSIQELRKELNQQVTNTARLSIHAVQEELYTPAKKLIVLDVDSTLIREEVIDELARHAGKAEHVQEITERAMNGHLVFEESLRERVKALEGVPKQAIEHVIHQLTLSPGVLRLIEALHSKGHKIAAVSGGFTHILHPLAHRIGLDYAHANTLDIVQQVLTGKVIGEVVTPEAKRLYLQKWAAEENVPLSHVVAIGDGANDIFMLEEAALGVAFCAKPSLQLASDVQLNFLRLDAVLHFMGL
ncbi:phosphoserine phosphatase SerB [Rothia sp. CCM 9419]|uniref:phosphoserine phosphatase SerB n=1 Tax=Rothia sp. CCM 9419 TaxID=3402662 RepID=UPI003AE6EA61